MSLLFNMHDAEDAGSQGPPRGRGGGGAAGPPHDDSKNDDSIRGAF